MASRVDEPPQPTSRLDWQTAKMGFQEKDAWSDESGVGCGNFPLWQMIRPAVLRFCPREGHALSDRVDAPREKCVVFVFDERTGNKCPKAVKGSHSNLCEPSSNV